MQRIGETKASSSLQEQKARTGICNLLMERICYCLGEAQGGSVGPATPPRPGRARMCAGYPAQPQVLLLGWCLSSVCLRLSAAISCCLRGSCRGLLGCARTVVRQCLSPAITSEQRPGTAGRERGWTGSSATARVNCCTMSQQV